MADPDYNAEEWRDIPGIDGYEASSLGRVRTKPKILKPYFNKATGYWTIRLGRRQFNGPIHKLVCLAFNGKSPFEKMDVAHGDGDRLNNSAGNLRWATRSENTADAVRHGTSKLNQYRTDGYVPRRNPNPPRGAAAASAKLDFERAAQIRKRHLDGESMKQIADAYGVGKSTVYRVVSGALWV